MPTREKFLPEKFYHIYNHAVGSDDLFKSHENYLFFLNKYDKYLFPIFKTYAYCLMPNHFHLLIQVRSEQTIAELLTREDDADLHKLIMQRFSNFLNSYAKAFNKQQSRRGALFVDFTKRKEITNENYFTKVINYIHQNPVNHGFCMEAQDWLYSSFNSIISTNKTSKLERNIIFDWFGGIEKFISFHKENRYFDGEIDSLT
jgi:REP element-mobilizing transposase RayT